MNFEAQSFKLSNFPLAFSELLALEIDKLDSLTLEKIDDTSKKNQSSYICVLVSRYSLRSLTFSQNYYKSFNSEELPGCYSVEKLILQKNKMEQVDSSLLYHLPHLQVLDLSGNQLFWNLCSLMPDRKNFISKLRILDFSANRLNSLQSDAFTCLPYLEELSLNDCGFKKIPISALYNLQQLKILNLRNNQLHSLANTTFHYLSNLVSLDLRGNPIKYFPRNSFRGLDLLRELYVGSYDIAPNIYFSVPNVTILVLESKDLIDFKKPTAAEFASVQNLSLSGFYILEQDQNHSFFPSAQMLHWEQAYYAFTFLQPLQYHFPQLEQLIYKYDFNYYLPKEFNLSHLSKLRVLEVHNLPEHSVSSSSMEMQYSFMDLPHLQVLKLVNSNIRYISAEFFRRNSKLKLLVLEKEEFLALDSDIQDQNADQMPLQYLHFSNTTFRCDCSSAWLISWAARKKGVFVSGLEQAECLDVQLRVKRFRFVSFLEQNCSQDTGLVLFTTTCLFLFLCIALPILNATCGLEFLFLCYMLRACCHGWWKGKRKRKFEYDAFVSYSSLDQEWVLQELVPNLEQTNPPFLKLCLHKRDFMVGKAIVDNITESLYNSHKAIFVISCHALASYWCSLEMSLATYRLLAEQEDTMILLFMEHVPRYQLSAYHRLAKLVKKKAYLAWPKDPEAQIIFWKRLRDHLQQHGDSV
ncbi:toll-like receptor 11 [Candoia aspera]|uniref:toll-like receptor 11 n=1 Tax=Candoia aspera TaxID=51853 RepID=UPI002FD7E5F0